MAVFLPKGLDCQTCTEQQKKVRGCKEDTATGYLLEDEVLKRCPLALINYETFAYLQIYNLCENFRKLPFSGSFAVQPAKVMIAFNFIKQLYIKKHNASIEKMKK